MSEAQPWLVVGLGNPGPKYTKNRHNIGFMAVTRYLEARDPYATLKERWKGVSAALRVSFPEDPAGARCVVLLPQTYMNKSGESVGVAASYNKIPPNQIVVLHDELDFEFGRIAVKSGGGHGGHNGLRDIVRVLGTRDFLRIRIGIGRPPHGNVSGWVLSDFPPPQETQLPELLDRVGSALTCLLSQGLAPAMNQFNVATS